MPDFAMWQRSDDLMRIPGRPQGPLLKKRATARAGAA
jgi:hypothetical protein